jgi:hypothetical protein
MPSGPSMAPERANTDPSILAPSQTKRALLREISAKWGKFSEAELSDLKSNDELVHHLVAKYSLDQLKAQADVDAFMHGRHL